MKRNRSVDTGPERSLRSAIWLAGLRGYRKNYSALPGKPDLAFNRAKLAVFVNGCFWHSCPTCTRNLTPTRNSAYWSEKLKRNRERDAENQAALEAMGYRVLVIWECEMKGAEGLAACAERVTGAIRDGRCAMGNLRLTIDECRRGRGSQIRGIDE